MCLFVTDEAGLNAAKPGGRLLGLFADGNMPQEWTGPAAKVGGTDPARCTPNGSFGGPHLSTMASRAIGLLDAQTRHSRKGFFLQIEGASMKMNYATNTPGQSQEHTGTQVRIAAKGPQAAGVLGVTDQTDLFRTLTRALDIR
ncbi:alkaline phosphatase [Actinomadura sp. NPDC000929]|uniref:alkaline phosphatase n=1 Tax=Actinomadura sp. NPDC000929 TaxID=3154517 RepID=UPI003394A9D6